MSWTPIENSGLRRCVEAEPGSISVTDNGMLERTDKLYTRKRPSVPCQGRGKRSNYQNHRLHGRVHGMILEYAYAVKQRGV